MVLAKRRLDVLTVPKSFPAACRFCERLFDADGCGNLLSNYSEINPVKEKSQEETFGEQDGLSCR